MMMNILPRIDQDVVTVQDHHVKVVEVVEVDFTIVIVIMSMMI